MSNGDMKAVEQLPIPHQLERMDGHTNRLLELLDHLVIQLGPVLAPEDGNKTGAVPVQSQNCSMGEALSNQNERLERMINRVQDTSQRLQL